MKITLDADDRHFEYEVNPLLAGAAIGGAVLLGAIHMVGFWAIPWAVGALVAVGVYKLAKDI